jgi:hypothetical protein
VGINSRQGTMPKVVSAQSHSHLLSQYWQGE